VAFTAWRIEAPDRRRHGYVDPEIERHPSIGRRRGFLQPFPRTLAPDSGYPNASPIQEVDVRPVLIRYQRGTYDPVVERGSTLTRFKVSMDLTGSYDGIRSFIHEVETAPEFIVIDAVVVTDIGGGAPLRLTMELSTYFRHASS
jgi:hypothetical protein